MYLKHFNYSVACLLIINCASDCFGIHGCFMQEENTFSYSTRFYGTLAAPKLLHIGKQKKKHHFLLFALDFMALWLRRSYSISANRRKSIIFFYLLSIFRNFADDMALCRFHPNQTLKYKQTR